MARSIKNKVFGSANIRCFQTPTLKRFIDTTRRIEPCTILVLTFKFTGNEHTITQNGADIVTFLLSSKNGDTVQEGQVTTGPQYSQFRHT